VTLGILLLRIPPGGCHGVEGYIAPAQGYLVKALYDDGEPMCYAAVEITSPDAQIAFQTGRTDRNGAMMFRPDRTGRWQAVVTDDLGHRLRLELTVAEGADAADALTGPNVPMRAARNRAANIITGISIIFGLSGLLYGWKGRRSRSAAQVSA
jgi:nickel transport protein